MTGYPTANQHQVKFLYQKANLQIGQKIKKGGTISKRKYRNRDWLYEKYVEEGKNQKEVSELCDVTHSTVNKWINKLDIPKRSRSEILKGSIHLDDKIEIDKEWIIDQYVNKKRTTKDIGQEIGYKDGRPIINILRDEGINIRTPGDYFRLDIDENWLREQYIDKKRSAMDIANELGYSDVGIFNALERFNIDTRKAENHFNPTNKFIELLDGTLLGDGWLRGYKTSGDYGLEQNNRPYIKWMYDKFNNFGIDGRIRERTTTRKEIARNFGRNPPEDDKELNSYTFNTLRYKELKNQYSRWYPNGSKIIPKDINITPLNMFIWFLEDGSAYWGSTKKVKFHTNGFNKEHVLMLKDKLSNELNISLSLYETPDDRGKQPVLLINRVKNMYKFIDYIIDIPEELKPYYGYKFPNLKEPALKLRR